MKNNHHMFDIRMEPKYYGVKWNWNCVRISFRSKVIIYTYVSIDKIPICTPTVLKYNEGLFL